MEAQLDLVNRRLEERNETIDDARNSLRHSRVSESAKLAELSTAAAADAQTIQVSSHFWRKGGRKRDCGGDDMLADFNSDRISILVAFASQHPIPRLTTPPPFFVSHPFWPQ